MTTLDALIRTVVLGHHAALAPAQLIRDFCEEKPPELKNETRWLAAVRYRLGQRLKEAGLNPVKLDIRKFTEMPNKIFQVGDAVPVPETVEQLYRAWRKNSVSQSKHTVYANDEWAEYFRKINALPDERSERESQVMWFTSLLLAKLRRGQAGDWRMYHGRPFGPQAIADSELHVIPIIPYDRVYDAKHLEQIYPVPDRPAPIAKFITVVENRPDELTVRDEYLKALIAHFMCVKESSNLSRVIVYAPPVRGKRPRKGKKRG